MISCVPYKMMPMAPAASLMAAIPPSSKPKIGFSIDSIVGSDRLKNHPLASSLSPKSDDSERPSSPISDCSYPLELRNSITNASDMHRNMLLSSNCSPDQPNNRLNRMQQIITSDFHRNFMTKIQQDTTTQIINNPSLINKNNNNHNNNNNNNNNSSISSCISPPLSETNDDKTNDKQLLLSPTPPPPLPPVAHHHQQNSHQQPAQTSKGPIVVPGIPAGLIRPFPVQPPSLGDLKGIPSYINAQEQQNAHFLAAQFQMAAAIAHGQAGQGFPPGAGMPPQHHPSFGNANMVRESYPLYPWLLSRHGRIFPHRFPGNFLLQPFRKPKRVRTAFSPSQLLKLEHAFESNHYVVGAERKTLAQALSLTETQVKVWFQNRRTKHKRMQQEEDAKGGNGGSDHKGQGDNNGSQTSYDEDDDELIDMEDCPSDDENDMVP